MNLLTISTINSIASKEETSWLCFNKNEFEYSFLVIYNGNGRLEKIEVSRNSKEIKL